VIRKFPLALAAASLALALGAPSALASETHRFKGSFNGSPEPFAEGFPFLIVGPAVQGKSSGESSEWVGALNTATFEWEIYRFDQKLKAPNEPEPLPTYAHVKISEGAAKESLSLFSFASPPAPLAVGSSGDLYVGNLLTGHIDRFSPEGKYECQITGEEKASSTECNGSAGSKVPQGSFIPSGLALGESGELYVSDFAHNVIDVFSSNGAFEKQLVSSAIAAPGAIAVGSEGHIYLVNHATESCPAKQVVELKPAGARNSEGKQEVNVVPKLPACPGPIAWDPETKRLLVYEPGESINKKPSKISEYDTEGKLVASFGDENRENPELGYEEAIGLGVAPNGYVFEATSRFENNKVNVFGPLIITPTILVEPTVSAESTNQVTLTAEVQPGSSAEKAKISLCEVEYEEAARFATSHTYTHKAPCSPSPPYSEKTKVTATLSGLSEATEYDYRLVLASGLSNAEKEETRTNGENHTFITEGMPHFQPFAYLMKAYFFVEEKSNPLLIHFFYHHNVEKGEEFPSPSEFAEIGVSTATLIGRINPYGLPTTCTVQWTTQAAYETSGFEGARETPCAGELPPVFGPRLGRAALSGLEVNTVYTYRFIARNSAGTAYGPRETFATFGVASLEASFEAEGGTPFSQAAGHPDAFTDLFAFNTGYSSELLRPFAGEPNPKDIITTLPPGLVGNPQAYPRCPLEEVMNRECPAASQVGVFTAVVMLAPCGTPAGEGEAPRELEAGLEAGEPVVPCTGLPVADDLSSPIYNIQPPAGVAAMFGGILAEKVPVLLDARVRTGSGYNVTVEANNISTAGGVLVVQARFWGDPASPLHNSERYCSHVTSTGLRNLLLCSTLGKGAELPQLPERPFLRAPTSCQAEPTLQMSVDSWEQPGTYTSRSAKLSPLGGCARVPFSPTITVLPEASSAATPSGLEVDLHLPQNENPNGLAEADLKDTTVTLPPGLVVNPSAATGRVGCPLLHGSEPHPGAVGIDLENGEPANCPNASKIGTVEITTPLLESPLQGAVYLAQQGNGGPALGTNPFGSLIALYISASNPQRGVVVKLAGKVETNPLTGQLTTTFDENPQLPFEDFKLQFFGGSRAPLATPTACGTYRTTTLLEPWSHQGAAGETGTPDATPSSPFTLTSGPGGEPCTALGGFAPTMQAGTTPSNAGAFAPFTLVLSRHDGEAALSTVSTTLPPGLQAILAGVPRCEEAAANAGTCPAASQIGTVRVQAGVGSHPVLLPEPGRREDPVYLTGPYKGAPFGLSIVVHPEAGPFNLEEGGHPVVVRAAIYVNPATAQVSVVSEPMPTILQGIPLAVRVVEVLINRPSFMFNPTNCNPLSLSAQIGSAQGQTALLSSPFQATNCATLPFHPSFAATSQAHTSRLNGASLTVSVGSHGGPGAKGEEANIAKVEVQLPAKLPSRLSTLNKACLQAQFAANPYGCPAASFVGEAEARTPVLSSPLRGPAIFVSRGAQFPNLEVLLEGEGIKIDLEGHTQIRHGITYSRFETVPDAPISSFTLNLPEGPHSALSANGSLCVRATVKRIRRRVHGHLIFRRRKVLKPVVLKMPTTITGQNGAVVRQTTIIQVVGCPKASRAARARRGALRRRRRGSARP